MNAASPFIPQPFPTPPKGPSFEVQVAIQQDQTGDKIRLRFVAVCWEAPLAHLHWRPFLGRDSMAFRVWELGIFQVPDSLDLPATEALATATLERMRDQIEGAIQDPAFTASRRQGLEEISDRVSNPFPALLEEVAHAN